MMGPESQRHHSSPQDLQKRLNEAEERFRLFMENVREYAVFMMDPEGHVVDWNVGAEKILGYGPEIVGQPFSIFFPPDDVKSGIPERELRRAVETGQASDDRWHVRKDGSYFWALGITTAMRDEQGALRGFTKVLRDSTERKHFEEQLNERNKALQEADRRKDEFLALLAHELRNPLAPIFTALTLLEDSRLSADVHRDARMIIGRQVRALARLVDDLLDVSRVTRGTIQLRKASVDLNTVVNNAVQTSASLLEAKRQKLTLSLAPGPIHVDGDQTRLEQVLVNLLSNASKFSAVGSSIDVALTLELGNATLRVKDSGVGLTPEELPRIFNLFTQGDGSLERSQGGLGVGLALVKNFVELHGGSVDAFSKGPGNGSEFVIQLPVLAASNGSEPLETQIQPPGVAETPLRILVVDDNTDVAKSVEILLAMCGHTVITVQSGGGALEAVQDSIPDVILLDIAMPGMNGYQVAERLRANPKLKNTALVAVTGYGQDEDRQRALRAGFDHHIVKPVGTDALMALLSAIGQGRSRLE